MASSIVIDLLMRTGAFETDTKRAERRMKALEREFKQIGRAIATAIVTAGALVVATFPTMIQQQRKVIDENAKFARSLNGSIDGLRTLQLVAEETGVENLEASLNRLRRRLGAVEFEAGPAIKAVKALNLNLEELAGADIDERIALIADAVRDFDGSSEAAARALQDLGFEQKNALELFRQGGDQIRRTRQDIIDFGLSMSEVDAAQVEAANDALGRTKLASEALSQQLTVEFAPIIQGVSEEFANWTKEMGGFGSVAEQVLERTVALSGFVLDAFEGVRRVVILLADAILIELNQPIARVAGTLATLTRAADRFSPFDMSGLTAEIQAVADDAEAVISGARANIDDTLMAPLPSVALNAWVEDVKASSREAAEAVVAARGDMDQTLSRPAPRVTLADVALGDSAFDEMIEGIRELEEGFGRAAGFVDRTRTQVERLEEQIAEVQELTAAGFFTDDRGNEVIDRLREQLAAAREALKEGVEEDVEEISEFAREAMRQTQNIIADTLTDGFDDGVKGILDSFKRMIDQLVAQALAAQIAEKIFGVEGEGGGWLDTAAGALGSFFGGGRARGGPVGAGVTYRINELEPEFFRPATSGDVIPLSRAASAGIGGGVTVNQSINVSGRPDQRTANQIAIEAARRQRVAQSRLG